MEKTKGGLVQGAAGESHWTPGHWNNVPREAVDFPTLDSSKTQLDRVLSNLLLPRKIGLDDPWGVPSNPALCGSVTFFSIGCSISFLDGRT